MNLSGKQGYLVKTKKKKEHRKHQCQYITPAKLANFAEADYQRILNDESANQIRPFAIYFDECLQKTITNLHRPGFFVETNWRSWLKSMLTLPLQSFSSFDIRPFL